MVLETAGGGSPPVSSAPGGAFRLPGMLCSRPSRPGLWSKVLLVLQARSTEGPGSPGFADGLERGHRHLHLGAFSVECGNDQTVPAADRGPGQDDRPWTNASRFEHGAPIMVLAYSDGSNPPAPALPGFSFRAPHSLERAARTSPGWGTADHAALVSLRSQLERRRSRAAGLTRLVTSADLGCAECVE
jgi:hypothetical protein